MFIVRMLMVMMAMTVMTRRIMMSMAVMLTGGQTYQRTDGHAYGQPGAYLTYMCGKYRRIAIHEKTKKQLHICGNVKLVCMPSVTLMVGMEYVCAYDHR